MYSSISFQDGKIKYRIENQQMDIGGEWLMSELKQFGWDVTSYSTIDCELLLHGSCPDERIIEVKKFIYDNYPYTMTVYPQTYSMCIDFSLPIKVLI